MLSMKRLLFPGILLLLCLTLMVSCGEDEAEPSHRRPAVLTEDSPLAALSSLDFENEEIVISLSKYTNIDIITTPSTVFIEGPDRITTDTVQNMIFNRNLAIEDAVGVSPRYVYTSLAVGDIAGDMRQKSLLAGRDIPDLYIDQAIGMMNAQMQGSLTNVLSSDETSHMDFETDGWYNDYMRVLSFGSDSKRYLLAGDYFMDIIRYVNSMACNLDLFDDLFYKDGGTTLLYDTVGSGNWTYDRFFKWCEAAHRKTGSAGVATSPDDQLGLATDNGGPALSGWFATSGVRLLHENNQTGRLMYPDSNGDAVTMTDIFIRLHHMVTGVAIIPGTMADMRAKFTSGTALFASGILLYGLETDEFQNMKAAKTVLPYPKIRADRDYHTNIYGTARIGGILKNTGHFEEVSAWLQGAALTSGSILNEYYNVALKFKYGSDIGTTKMLDILYEHIDAPYDIVEGYVGGTYAGEQPINSTAMLNWTSNRFTSLYESAKSPLRKYLTDAYEIFDDLD